MKHLIRNSFLMISAVAALSATPVLARNVTADVDQIAKVMTAAGHSLEVKNNDGERFIMADGSGYKYAILPYGCDDKGKACKSVQFFIAFNPDKSPTLEAMNEYSRDHRWGRVYLDKDGDPALEFDLDLEQGGMTEELFLDNVAYWEAILESYAKFAFEKE